MLTISQFKAEVTPKLHGLTLQKIGTIEEKLREAAATVLSRISPPTTIRRARIENAIYDRVYNYTAPDDLKDDDVIDIRPIGERSAEDAIAGRYGREFDIRKGTDTFAVESVNGVKTLRLSKELAPRTVLARLDSLTIGGTVTGGGDVQNLAIDTLDCIAGFGAVSFDLSGATGTGTITVALPAAIDLSRLENLGALFSWLNFPEEAALTSVTLRFGSSASDYWEATATTAHDRAFESNTWMLLRHDWNGASQTGTPDAAAVDYLQIIITYTSGTAQSGVKLDNITAALGEAWEVLYYSNRAFKGADGTWKEKPTADTDTIMLDPDATNILLYQFLMAAAHEKKGRNARADIDYYRVLLDGDPRTAAPGLYATYAGNNPSQAVEMQTTYYRF